MLTARVLEMQSVDELRTGVTAANEAAVDFTTLVHRVEAGLDARMDGLRVRLMRDLDDGLVEASAEARTMINDGLTPLRERTDDIVHLGEDVRTYVLRDVEAQRLALVRDFETAARSLVDYVLWRLLQLFVALSMLLLLVSIGLAWLILRRRPHEPFRDGPHPGTESTGSTETRS